ncbi:uncharacterized protein TRUGW13939_00104 [Talaromyces rugulosus]|uniref:Uncharacterized protein n=1 Tax=Talaromyces rugulosus TaxID=121627 RepID=A0A7H8QIM8_TALRU|nr:uncharacterized protein TRUGW13939_00104 [Talaromyces rugulosus]QKX53033.1 hypothetical protein TRUGW13939_00104 [Talaromyces rugulosus]
MATSLPSSSCLTRHSLPVLLGACDEYTCAEMRYRRGNGGPGEREAAKGALGGGEGDVSRTTPISILEMKRTSIAQFGPASICIAPTAVPAHQPSVPVILLRPEMASIVDRSGFSAN